MLHCQLITLGKFEFSVQNRAASPPPTHKSRALLAFLVSNAGHDIARERLLELFWADSAPERAREGLRTALSSIRHALRSAHGAVSDFLVSDNAVVRWTAAAEYDADRFAQLASSCDPASKADALALYGGDFLEGNYEEWAVRERERLASIYETMLTSMLEEGGDPHIARQLLERNRYNERAYAVLIDTEVRSGRLQAAAELFAAYRAALVEAGLEPSPVLEERYARIDQLNEKDESKIDVPFVARVAELQFLKEAFQDRVGSTGFTTLIVGEPGIGKTALLMRAVELARDSGRRCLMVSCRDDPHRLAAWRGLYASLTGRNLDDLAGGRTNVAAEAAREMVDAFGKPTGLFVDDAHLLHGDSLALLADTTRAAQSAGHGVVVTLRPEAADRVQTRLSGCAHDVLFLGPLQRTELDALLGLIVESGNASFSEALYERSGGHPLFCVALLQSLVRKHALRLERGQWKIVRQIDERLELPRDLRTSLEARLNEAGEDAAVVACALALESSATAEDIANALDFPEVRVFDALDRLLSFQLIRESSKPAQYEFGHDLVRDVSASLLNAGRRVALHRAFARLFETKQTADANIRRARHLRAAGNAGAAARAFLEAAKTALERSAAHDAMEYSEEGVGVLERVQRNAETELLASRLERVRARASGLAGDIPVALAAANEAVRCARVNGDALEKAKSLIVRSSLHGALDDTAVQLTDALEASACAAEAGKSHLRARAAVEAAAATRTAGAVDEAMRIAEEASQIARECNDPGALYAAYEEMLKTELGWWRFAKARLTLHEASIAAERAGAAAQARLCCIRAAFKYLCDDAKGAREELESAMHYVDVLRVRGARARNLTYRYPFPLIAVVTDYLRGVLATVEGAWDDALLAVSACRQYQTLANLPRYNGAVSMLEIDALLGRNGRQDVYRANDLKDELGEMSPDGLVGLSDCSALVRARIAVRVHDPGAYSALRTALDAVEENARRFPLDCDRAFNSLAGSAREYGDEAICRRACARATYYRSLRTAAVVPEIDSAYR